MNLKDIWTEISCHFYADEIQEGMESFLKNATRLAEVPGGAERIGDIFDAIERQDYIFAADILQFEIIPMCP